MRFVADGSPTQPLCPLCQNASGTVQYVYPDQQIIRCDQCGLWRTCPRLSEDTLKRYYEEHYYSPSREKEGDYQRWRDEHRDVWAANAALVALEARRRGLGDANTKGQGIRVLDVGCGHGFFLEACQKEGLDCYGIETSPHAVAYATAELKLNVRQATIETLPSGELYDVVTLWGVLEHVDQPLETMRHVYAHARPGGMVWVMTPNIHALDRFAKGARWFNFLNKSHLTHFDRRALKQLLERAGFENVRRYLHWGGGGRSGIGAVAQYAARVLCLGTELRFIANRPMDA